MQLQMPLLSHLHTLILSNTDTFPDMSAHKGITSLVLDSECFKTESQWLFLPQQLRHLEVSVIECGPPAICPDGRSTLGNLRHLTSASMSLRALVQILQAAPGLLLLDCAHSDGLYEVNCDVGPTTAEDMLTLLRRREEVELLTSANYRLGGGFADGGELLQPLTLTLPRMTGFRRLSMTYCSPEETALLLPLFPEVEHLTIDYPKEFGDIALKTVASCEHLHTLELSDCHALTPVGVFALCLQLPQLSWIDARRCRGLQQPVLLGLVQLLRAYGSQVEFGPDDSSSED